MVTLLMQEAPYFQRESIQPLRMCRRPHQSLAAVGVAALVRLIVAAGDRMSATVWVEAIGTLAACATDTCPAVRELVAAVRMSSDSGGIQPPASPSPATPAAAAPEDSPWSAKSPEDSPRGAAVPARSDSISGERRQVSPLFSPRHLPPVILVSSCTHLSGLCFVSKSYNEYIFHAFLGTGSSMDGTWNNLVLLHGAVIIGWNPKRPDGGWDVRLGKQVSLASGSGARRLAEARCRAAIQLLLVQACGEVYASHAPRLPQAAAILMLDALAAVAEHARDIDADLDLRRSLAAAQAAGKVGARICAVGALTASARVGLSVVFDGGWLPMPTAWGSSKHALIID